MSWSLVTGRRYHHGSVTSEPRSMRWSIWFSCSHGEAWVESRGRRRKSPPLLEWICGAWGQGTRSFHAQLYSDDFILLHCSRGSLNVDLSLVQSPDCRETQRAHTSCMLDRANIKYPYYPSFSIAGPLHANRARQCKLVERAWSSHQVF